MNFWRSVKRGAQAAIAPVAFMALTGYFGWAATQGDRGLEATALRRDQLRLARADVAHATADQETWERRVASLRLGRLDLDALDERARAMLNLADPADITVMYGPGKKLF